MVRFLLNNNEHNLSACSPHITVLDYLREELQQKGTKEGCASGDCGACTVVLGEAVDGVMAYKAINACITPAASLHGKQLITVEHLKQEQQLHPVQQAMVDCHGSQCGFCTPGFVMSMFAYRKNHDAPQRDSIVEALGGNLCRCTGYRPIIEAAVQMYEPGMADQFTARAEETVQALDALNSQEEDLAWSDEASGQAFYAPRSIDALAELMLAHPQAKLVAGGTDLSLEFTQFLREFDVLISTTRVPELLEVTETESSIEIGAAVTYSRCVDILARYYPDMRELLERLGSLQIRNQGTLGGNVGNASPIGDMPPVLIALGARLVLRCGAQTRELPVQDYFVRYKVTAQQPSEFIERIIIPKPAAGYDFRVYKISKRLEDDISASCGAFYLKVDAGQVVDAKIAFGGMAEIPRRATHCEAALVGQPWQEQTVSNAMQALASDFQPISDFRASADYRLAVSQNFLKRLFLELQPGTAPVRVTHYA